MSELMTPAERKAEALRLYHQECVRNVSEIARRIGVNPTTATAYIFPEKAAARRAKAEELKSPNPGAHRVTGPRKQA